MKTKFIIASLVIISLLAVCTATETTWRHPGFEVYGYDINFTSHNISNINTITTDGNKELHNPEIGPTYIVFTDGSTIYAKNGTTGVIDYSGSSFSTVLNDTIAAGGYVKIAEGDYSISAQISLPTNVRIEGAGIDLTVMTLANSADIYPLKNLDATNGNDDIHLAHFTLDLNGDQQSSAGWLALSGTSNSSLQHIKFENGNTHSLLWQAIGDPITGTHSKYNLISDCIFNDNAVTSDVAILNIQDSIIRDCYFYDGASGSNYALSAGVSMKNLQIYNNHFIDTGGSSIGLEDVQNVQLYGNTINNSAQHGIYLYNASATISEYNIIGQNIIMNSGVDGINTDEVSYTIFSENIIVNSDRAGISSQSAFNNSYTGNLIIDNNVGGNSATTGCGIRLPGGTPGNNTISGNIILGNHTYGIYSGNGDYQRVYNNDIRGYATGALSMSGSNNIERDNYGAAPYNFGVLGSAPTPFGAGDTYYSSGTNIMYCYNGSAWNALY